MNKKSNNRIEIGFPDNGIKFDRYHFHKQIKRAPM